MRNLILVTCALTSFPFGAHDASAQCYCLGGNLENEYRGSRYSTAYEEFKNSEIVFVGEFVDMKKIVRPPAFSTDFPYEYEIRFKVKKAWKKNLKEFISLRSWAGCLVGFKEGEEYLVYAFIHKRMLRTNYCSRTKLLAKAAVDLKEFDENGETAREIIKRVSDRP